MKLLTKQLKKQMPKLYATDSLPLGQKEAICRFFNPFGVGTWYAVEGEEEDSDYIFFGLAHIHEWEWGYFSLKEMEAIRIGRFQGQIERDLFFEKAKIKDIAELKDLVISKEWN